MNCSSFDSSNIFSTQWKRLKKYANKKGIQIIGDIPIYVALDSADTWIRYTRLFQFNTKTGEPVAVAGCPPIASATTGQLWGNPLYDWKYHKDRVSVVVKENCQLFYLI